MRFAFVTLFLTTPLKLVNYLYIFELTLSSMHISHRGQREINSNNNNHCFCFYKRTSNYLSKFNNENTRTICRIYTKLTIKIPENVIDIHRSDALIVKFKHISHSSGVFIVDYEQVNAGQEMFGISWGAKICILIYQPNRSFI